MPKAASLRGSAGMATVPIEKKKLVGFERVTLAAGASTTVTFELGPTHLAMTDLDGHIGLHKGSEFGLMFTRGHGEDLVADARVLVAERLQTFIKWW